jgi:hypothetical protein
MPPLERLGELVDRVVTLLDEAPKPAPPEQTVPEPAAVVVADVEEQTHNGHVLFVPAADGYRLVVGRGPAPSRFGAIEVGDGRYRVARVGRSPLPGDRRRCAYLEQERQSENRTPTGARGEPDRRDAGSPPG